MRAEGQENGFCGERPKHRRGWGCGNDWGPRKCGGSGQSEETVPWSPAEVGGGWSLCIPG